LHKKWSEGAKERNSGMHTIKGDKLRGQGMKRKTCLRERVFNGERTPFSWPREGKSRGDGKKKEIHSKSHQAGKNCAVVERGRTLH